MTSDNRNSTDRGATSGSTEVHSPQEHLRPLNEYLTDVSDNDREYCVMRCTLPAGAVVPMQSHADRETFYVLSGTVNALRGDRWETLGPGDVLDVQDGIKHAWRNVSQASAMMICVTTMRMGRFLQQISVAAGSASPEESVQRFHRLVQEHGYWLASPEENAAVGLDVSWTTVRN
jgi:quercetin dioxygenase-like cupin family protein